MEEKGVGPVQAAIEGTREIGMAVVAMSLSLIAVFLPVAFMGGIVGRFMASFGVTMAFAIGVSIIVAFTLTPMLASRWLRHDDVEGEASSRERGFYPVVEKAYMAALEFQIMDRVRNEVLPQYEVCARAEERDRDRLRPILMTTLAFVAGMLPLVVSSGVGSGTNRAIASVIIGGQTLALVLTLVGTPVAYSIFDDWSTKKPLRSFFGRMIGRKAA